jgi:hypothetical protein
MLKRFTKLIFPLLAVALLSVGAFGADIPSRQLNFGASLVLDNATGTLNYSAESGRLRNIVYITSTQAYAKPAWLKFAIVKCVGGGGGGGGAALTGAGVFALGGGGGGGGYSQKKINAASLAASETITVGVGGLAGTAGANNGGNGGTTSFGAIFSATGGAGGAGCPAAANTSAAGGVGGEGIGGDINLDGRTPTPTRSYSGILFAYANAGSSFLSAEPSGNVYNQAGNNGRLYGGGATGAVNVASQAARAGGVGGAGIVIIEEYE